VGGSLSGGKLWCREKDLNSPGAVTKWGYCGASTSMVAPPNDMCYSLTRGPCSERMMFRRQLLGAVVVRKRPPEAAQSRTV